MTITKAILLFAFASLLAINTAHSAPKELKAEIIESWMASQKIFEEWGEKYEHLLSEAEETDFEDMSPMDLSVESMIQPLKNAGLLNSANSLAKKSGFENMQHWAATTLRITKAAAALEFDSHPEMNNLSELEKLIDSPNLNKKQKAILIDTINKNKAIVKQFTDSVSEFDKVAVKPFLAKIHQLIDPTD